MREQPAATRAEFDSVTQDAIRDNVRIPPTGWPQDQRRAYLGGAYTKRRGGDLAANPYADLSCASAWRRGFVEEDT